MGKSKRPSRNFRPLSARRSTGSPDFEALCGGAVARNGAPRASDKAKVPFSAVFLVMFAMDTSIWDQILARIETKVNRHSFSTWFKPTSFVADGGNAITVRVPNPLFKDWVTKHYSVVLAEALAEVRRPETSLVFVAEPDPPPALPPESPAVAAETGAETG